MQLSGTSECGEDERAFRSCLNGSQDGTAFARTRQAGGRALEQPEGEVFSI